MALATVPDYFQETTEEALREQVEWLVREVGVDDSFFARLLRVEQATFADWRSSSGSLLPANEQTLHSLWQMTLHLLSFLNCDEVQLREFFQLVLPTRPGAKGSLVIPPWSGSTLRTFLETEAAGAIERVERWVTGLRFGDPYAA